MKRVVLFKGPSEEYQQGFSDHNYETIFVQPLQFTHIHLDQLEANLNQSDYTGLVITSSRAVEAAAQCWDLAKFVLWNTKRVYTVGDASCRKIKLLLGLEALGNTSGNAENLAKVISKENPPGSRFLFPCGNLRSETLPNMLQSNDITVVSLTVYETKENENLKAALMELSQSQHNPCCMVFFSPSGCEYIHRQLQTFSNQLTHLPYFAIGSSTAHKIENLGIEIAGVAEQPIPESVIESVQKYFSSGACSSSDN